MKDHFHFHLIKVFAGKKPKNVKLVDDKLSFFEGVARDQRGGRANGDERTEL